MSKLLVDCDCTVTVYSDGSGIEMHYCDEHEAAPELLEALRGIMDDASLRDTTIPPRLLTTARAAIAKAEGK